MRIALLAAAAALLASAAEAEIVERTDSGFTTRHVAQISAPPERVYQAIGQLSRWWDPAHSYSGKAENLSIELKPGGCWCEIYDGGGVRHGVVLLALPSRTVRADAALGPLQDQAVTAIFTWQLAAKDGGTQVVQTYKVGAGGPKTAEQFATAVDGVIGAGLSRLERYVETGKPD